MSGSMEGLGEVQSAKYSAERLTFGTMDAFERPLNNKKLSLPSGRTYSPRKSAIPRPPLPVSPAPGVGYAPQFGGTGMFYPPVVAPPPVESPRRSYSPGNRRFSAHRHSTTVVYPPPVVEDCETPEAPKGDHQRNHSAPIVGHARAGSEVSTGGKEICRYFLRTGTCGYGNKCRYDHPKSAHKPNLNTQGYPIREGECICRFFVKNGWCGFGATCKFHHPELPQRPPQVPPVPSSPYHTPAAYSPVPPMYPVPPHPGMYHHQGVMPTTTCMSPAMPPVTPNMYPYMFMNGMAPPMVPPAQWAVPPPMPPHMAERSVDGFKHDGIKENMSGSGSNVSTSSVVSNGHGDEGELESQNSLGSSIPPPASQ